MAKAKLKKPRTVTSNNNLDHLKKGLENDLYLHSSPPKVVQGGSGTQKIREYIRAGDIIALEEILLAGHGQSLINQPSTDRTVRAFLKTVPSYMSKIDLVHDAAERGNLRDLKALLDRRKLSRSRDGQGVGLLHKAVLGGHKDVVDYLISEYPECADVTDHDGRTPLHYSAASKNPEEMFSFLSDRVLETQYRDDKGKPASYYMQHPSELPISSKDFVRNGLISHKKKMSPLSKKNSPIHKLKTPPKREGLNITGANIRIWIHDQDLPKLEQIVWEGQGHRLLNETSNNTKVRQFLHLVPKMMSKIREVHQAAISGDLETMEAKADQPEILLAKDQNGLNPLHRSAALGHTDVCQWIVAKNPSAIFGTDRKGRTPLHYATIPSDGGEIYDLFVGKGVDPGILDQFNRTADYYRGRPGEIDVSIVYDSPSAPRIGGSTIELPPTSKLPSRNNSGGRQRVTGGWVTSPLMSYRSFDSNAKSNSLGSENGKKTSKRNNFYVELYNKGRKDYAGKRKFVDLKNVTEKEIEKMIQEGDVSQLESVVLSGRGDDLRGRSSWNDQVRRFLKKVPSTMEKINALQTCASVGNIQMVKQLTRENPKFAMARNKDGAIALHFAAKSGNVEVVKHLLDLYLEGMFVEDKELRVPVHWAAISREPGAHQNYELLERKGSYVHACDMHGKSADDYFKGSDYPVESRSTSSQDIISRLTPATLEAESPLPPRRRSLSKSPSKSIAVKSRSNSKSPGRTLPTPTPKIQSKSPSKSENKFRSRKIAKSPSKKKLKPKPTAVDVPATSSVSPSENNNIDILENDEIQQAISDAENEDYKGISHIILRGDGSLLVGRKSANEEVQRFLDDLPESLRSIKEIQGAVEEGNIRKTTHLIDRREKAYVRDANESNLLHTATINGHTDVVRYLVQNFPDLINQRDKKGRTPLHYAAVLRDGGHILKILKMSDGDPYLKDYSDHSAEDYVSDPELLPPKVLMEELARGKAEKESKQNGINADSAEDNHNNEDDEKEMENDIENERDEEQDEKEEEQEEGKEEEETKENDGSKELADIESNQEEDKTDEEKQEKEKEVRKAIEMAENEDFEGLADIVRRGEGKLLLGRTSSNEQVQHYLDKTSAILESINELYKATEEGETRKVTQLLDKKEKARVKTLKGASLLHVAVINGHSDTVRYLIQAYPTLLEDEDINGRTPLHYAAVVRDGGHIYKILKRAEADSSIKDKSGHTPEDYLHDPQLLTQWDLMKELKDQSEEDKETRPISTKDGKSRPITKDSSVSYYGSEEEGMMLADTSTVTKIEEAYENLKNKEGHSMLKKYLTQEVFDKLKHRITESGANLLDVINSGVQNPDSSIGVYAPDAESYIMFKELFDPIIDEYHGGFGPTDEHPAVNYGDANQLGDLNKSGDFVVSTRIRCARSLEGYPFNPKITLDQYSDLEQDIEGALDMLDADLAGYYTSLSDMSPETAEKLTNEHLMFKQGDRFLEAAGACRFWSKGRGIFLNSDETFVVWVNEEDHMRIISMEPGGNLQQVYDRFIKGLCILEGRLPFSHSQRLGFLTFCPTNLGTAIRASVHIRLPYLGKDEVKLNEIAAGLHLQVRGTSGEHSDTTDFVYDISNKRRLGITEIEAIEEMYKGIQNIIEIETQLATATNSGKN